MNGYQKKQQKEALLKELSKHAPISDGDSPVERHYMHGMQMGTVVKNMGKISGMKVTNLNVPLADNTNNINFITTKHIDDTVIEGNTFLNNFILFIKDDLKHIGRLASYYNYIVHVENFSAFDSEDLFIGEMKKLTSGMTSKGYDYITECVIFNNITINGFNIKKLTMKTLCSEALGIDPTALQLGQMYSTGSYSYLTVEL